MRNKRVLVLLLGLVFMLEVVACGNKETDKKASNNKTEEVVQSEVEDDKADVEEGEEAETTEDSTQSETPENTQSDSTQSAEPVVTKTTMYAKSNVNVRSGAGTSNSQIGSLTKGQEVVKIGEENGWSKIEFNSTVGYVSSKYLSTEKVETNTQSTTNSSNNNSSTSSSIANNTTSNNNQGNTGNNTGSSSTSGMYSKLDSAALERLDKCANILSGGIVNDVYPIEYHHNFVSYWGGAIMISAESTSGAWMYVLINRWSTNQGSEETGPIFAEIPSLTKKCLEAIAPDGGTELYNKVNALILQYGDVYDVPTQGTISESIPGLYVTLTQGRGGVEIRFFAE